MNPRRPIESFIASLLTLLFGSLTSNPAWAEPIVWQPVSKTAAAKEEQADWVLAHEARAALWNDPTLADLSLEVVVEQGVATLYGPAPTEEMRKRAETVVQRTKGIKSVRNLLRVRGDAPVLDPPSRPQLSPAGVAGQATPFEDSGRATLPPAASLASQPRPSSPAPGSQPEWQPATVPERGSSVDWRPVKGTAAAGAVRPAVKLGPIVPFP